ncbi:hypothetical protein [Mycobacteroides immunogenum]|uniref:Uncharacterized protein n=1 Tax=Mycobacteroides immunogenum TaxID=83262 RepID=A0A7V8LR10_9MYCO|nr:hypothetical protein [Mycobacteroides immunogenum]KPG13702.1 hypothetical protein AN909_05400 [Mycobacteroides immunogenum]KPG14309.1 hypothetical protein AN908_07005 [Mycobacteroides immunogenum]KPG14377.1 hypothetical protein AN908_07460 [Mycobacteroides immunogenum]KPG17416.1 hypothetical protein AN910_04625 [Mycobacteroides immunogenum]KPG24000.1 hypothetical protein AN911_00535 [Mycobacteroides immunogenum]
MNEETVDVGELADFEELVFIADSFYIAQDKSDYGIPYMALIAAETAVREAVSLPMNANMAERLGWSLIECAQKHRIKYGIEG